MAQDIDTTSMNVSLPRDQKEYVDDRVANGGFGSVSEYVRGLIRQDQEERNREALERRLLVALTTPSSDLSEQDWTELRNNVLRRHAERNGK